MSSALDSPRAWIVVAAAFAANLVTFGTMFSFGVFLTPIADALDTTTGPVAPVFSAAVLLYYLAGALGGRLGDRLGVRPVVGVGGVCLVIGLGLTSRVGSLWQLYLAYPLFVGVAVGCCYPPLIGVVGRWFVRWRALAIAIVLTGVATGTLVGPIASEALIDAFGWRTTLLTYAAVAAVTIAGAAIAAGDPPVEEAPASVSLGDLARSVRFRRLYVALMLVSPGFYAPLVFLKDQATADGISGGGAALLVGIIGGSSALARPVIGLAGGRFDPLRQYRASYLVMFSALLTWFLADGSFVTLVVAAVLHGIGWAVWVTAAPAVLSTWFGARDLGGVLGAFYTGLGLGALAGPAVTGFVIDRWGYQTAIGLAVATTAAAIVAAMAPMRDPATPSAT